MDKQAKFRSRLIKSEKNEDRIRAKKLDREINRTFRRNVRLLQLDIEDMISDCNPMTENNLLKRALALAKVKNVAPFQVDPDKDTEFMRSLHPANYSTRLVPVQCFEVPE